ncbi:MAG: hypothetical protein O2960_11650 [Verrucomicrobia bacterium]|nr:hypothetical protein [Verrucomicrobiota bacterium]
MIQRISLDQAQPGMIIAEPILDSGGQVLILGGEVLSDRLIRRLIVRGAKEIAIQGEEPEAPPEVPKTRKVKRAETEEEIRELLDLRFQNFENHEIMQTIRALAEKHLVQKLGSSETGDAAAGSGSSN